MSSLVGKEDRFGGVTVTEFAQKTADEFAPVLQSSLTEWRNADKKGIWLKIPTAQAALVPAALAEGFEMHHCQKDYLMLTQWLPSTPSLLPGYATHYIGAGCLCINSKDEVLVVAERFAPLEGMEPEIRYKLPGGMIDAGESLGEAVEREVREETGVEVRFVSIGCFRHNPAYPGGFGNADMYFVARCEPVDEENMGIKMDEREIAACEWMPLEKFLNDTKIFR